VYHRLSCEKKYYACKGRILDPLPYAGTLLVEPLGWSHSRFPYHLIGDYPIDPLGQSPKDATLGVNTPPLRFGCWVMGVEYTTIAIAYLEEVKIKTVPKEDLVTGLGSTGARVPLGWTLWVLQSNCIASGPRRAIAKQLCCNKTAPTLDPYDVL
jgi:hypothetical protein